MGIYNQGTGVRIVETFSVVGTPTNPTTVVYKLRSPAGALTTYVWGVAAEVTNPSVGVFVLTLPGTLTPGHYRYRIEGTGAVEAACDGDFTILASPTLGGVVEGGPCAPWVDGDSVLVLCSEIAESTDTSIFDDWITIASELLFHMSGRQFPGICSLTVRPCGTGGICAGWAWPLTQQEAGWALNSGVWGWYLPDGQRSCGCYHVSRVHLPDYPVVGVTEVTIDGVVVDPATYELRELRYLDRLGEAVWPACQDMRLSLGEVGTWGVTYTWGTAVPASGVHAAAVLACELYTGSVGGECQLPKGVTSLVRQGVSMSQKLFAAWGLQNGQWATGLPAVDAFLQAVNPYGLIAPTTVWSPDLEPFPRPEYA